MMECVSKDELRDRYLIQDLFRDGECVLDYTHAERFVIGGAAVRSGSVKLPDQTKPASAAGHPFLERRELAVVNVSGTVTVDGETFTLGNKDCLYVTMGAKDVQFSGDGARFYLASCPAHKAFTTREISVGDATTLERGSPEESNERTIYKMVIPGTCDSAAGRGAHRPEAGLEHDAAAHPRELRKR
jgi:4-deoxy-L-threo-5-hexosulose-uronate ketol-isomerase